MKIKINRIDLQSIAKIYETEKKLIRQIIPIHIPVFKASGKPRFELILNYKLLCLKSFGNI